ncbi:MAG: response regulator transcription factor [Alphaproteobacteria bacterium]|nr:response regulator transcription factor [Alphaproteobacteria bacterium]
MGLLHFVSNDAALRQAVEEQIGPSGLGKLVPFDSLTDAWASWRAEAPQALLIDEAALDPAEPSCSEMISTMARSIPIFVLGDDQGALGDAVTESFSKPLRLGHLLTRLAFYMQVRRQTQAVEVALGPWVFAPRARQLTESATGAAVKLTDKETSLLDYLCQAGQPVLRDDLLAAVWGYDGALDTHTLETHIYRLRRKLMTEEDAARGDLFVVEKGGYGINPKWLGR